MTLHVDQMSITREGGQIIVHIPMTLKVRGGRKEIILPEGIVSEGSPAKKAKTQRPLVIALARAYRWKALLESGKYRGLSDLARALHLDPSYISRHLNLTLLAPDIVEMILHGDEPSGLSLEQLIKALPLDWQDQRIVLTAANPRGELT